MNELHQYFTAERQAGMLAVALGAASLTGALYLWSTRGPFRAAAWPLIVIGLIELGLGGALVVRTPSQVRRLDAAFASAPQAAAAGERQRMARVNRAFRFIMAGELALIVLGASAVFVLRSRSDTWTAIGMAVMLQAAVLMAFDLFAEHRAHVYSNWLSRAG
jgi:hypothetical protein